MPNYSGVIDSFVVGDDLEIERNVSGIPTAQTITTAWLTIKRAFKHADSNAVIQKVITTTNDDTKGVILDNGASGTATIVFYLTPEETLLLNPYSSYVYDIQVETSAGKISTPEVGTITANPQVTITTS